MAWRCIWPSRYGDVAYFRSAKQALRKLHRAGICHNDLAKEQNWLRGSDGRAYVTDFQLAACFKTRSRLFRIAAYEDLRHLLKHKRSYAPEALTPKERKILARKSLVASVWLATGKKVYRAITRGLFNFTDREGGGRRLVNDAPVLVELIRKNPAVRDAAIVAFADRRSGVGLYAFVEADQTALEAQLRDELAAAKGPKPPEHIQVVQALPRDSAGKPRTEILQLVAMNQLDLIEPMMTSETDRAFLKSILESRKNLRDRFNFEAADLASPPLNGRHPPRRRVIRYSVTLLVRSMGLGVPDTRLRGYRRPYKVRHGHLTRTAATATPATTSTRSAASR